LEVVALAGALAASDVCLLDFSDSFVWAVTYVAFLFKYQTLVNKIKEDSWKVRKKLSNFFCAFRQSSFYAGLARNNPIVYGYNRFLQLCRQTKMHLYDTKL
jgi:hypothetical protein